LDPTFARERLTMLKRMGFDFGKTLTPGDGPNKYHGVAARMRKTTGQGQQDIKKSAHQRRQHHKEKLTIRQVNELADLTREINGYVTVGKRVPTAVWEKYDRVNKKHKKHDEMKAIAEEMQRPGRGQHHRDVGPADGDPRKLQPLLHKKGMSRKGRHTFGSESLDPTVKTRSFGLGCTFGSRNLGEPDEKKVQGSSGACEAGKGNVRGTARRAPLPWTSHERRKLNELYLELGRPARRGADALSELLGQFSRRHCLLFPRRTPWEVGERLRTMFRRNTFKASPGLHEPGEAEYWQKVRMSGPAYSAPCGMPTPSDTAQRPTEVSKIRQRPLSKSQELVMESGPKTLLSEPLHETHTGRVQTVVDKFQDGLNEFPTNSRDSCASDCSNRNNKSNGGRGRSQAFCTAAAEHPAATAASPPDRQSPPHPAAPTRKGTLPTSLQSPFYDPTRPSSPSWPLGGRSGSQGGHRTVSGCPGGPEGRGGGGGDVGPGAGGSLLEYTSLGPQPESGRPSTPAYSFGQEGLGSENLTMFQANKRPEPGPGSFKPNLSATSTHPAPRCGVKMAAGGLGAATAAERADGGGVGGLRAAGVGGEVGGKAGGGVTPGPGQYDMICGSIGRQVLSTRPSSPKV
ncbi:unnamed protein product, partial [Discosporangium mesarthrocarpum]